MKKNKEFDFREHWYTLSDDPYPPKKLCRHVLKELSYARADYMCVLGALSAYVIVDNLLDDTEEDDDYLSWLEEDISFLLKIASVLWDSYQVRPYSLRYRRKLDSLIKRLERDLDCVVILLNTIVLDVDMLNTIVVGENYITPSDIATVPYSMFHVNHSHLFWPKVN
jgi:hypothetical protein